MAGDACKAVLELAADFLEGNVEIQRLSDELVNTPLESELKWRFRSSSSLVTQDSSVRKSMQKGATDVALKKYEDAIVEWKQCKMLFSLIKYDPFQVLSNSWVEPAQEYRLEVARILARTLRIQTTVVMIDGMVRSDADYDLNLADLETLRQIGSCMKNMLKMPVEKTRNDDAATKLFVHLEALRRRLATLRHEAVQNDLNSEREENLGDFHDAVLGRKPMGMFSERDDLGRGLPKHLTESDENTLFFLQLVEHLVLRTLRLYQSCKQI
jgi:hypothetical protein